MVFNVASTAGPRVYAAFGGVAFPATSAGWGAMAGIVTLATLVPVSLFLLGVSRVGATNAAILRKRQRVEKIDTVTRLQNADSAHEILSRHCHQHLIFIQKN